MRDWDRKEASKEDGKEEIYGTMEDKKKRSLKSKGFVKNERNRIIWGKGGNKGTVFISFLVLQHWSTLRRDLSSGWGGDLRDPELGNVTQSTG